MEGDFGIISGDYASEQRKRAILQFHYHPIERRQQLRYIEQLQNNGLILAKHVACRDTKQQTVSDLACSTRNRYANRRIHSCAPVGGNCRDKKFLDKIPMRPARLSKVSRIGT